MPYVIVRIWARLSPAPRWSDFFPELSEKEGGGKDHDYEEINELMIGLDTSPRHNPDDDAPKFIAAVMTDRG